MRGDSQSDVEGTRYPAVVPDTLEWLTELS